VLTYWKYALRAKMAAALLDELNRPEASDIQRAYRSLGPWELLLFNTPYEEIQERFLPVAAGMTE